MVFKNAIRRLILLPLFSISAWADGGNYYVESWVIVASVKKYDEAVAIGKKAAKALGYPFKTNGYYYDLKHGLTQTREYCEKEIVNGTFPCDLGPRGGWEPELEVSVEYSSWYEGKLAPGLYVVMVASYSKNSQPSITPKPAKMVEALNLAKARGFKDAYIKVFEARMPDTGH